MLRTVKLKGSISNKELIPETSEIGPVPQLGVCPDCKVQLNFDFPELSFAHSQNVESSKLQSSTWHNANKNEIRPRKKWVSKLAVNKLMQTALCLSKMKEFLI